MANSFPKLQELNLTRDEVERIGTALKNKEFRKLFTEYVEELQDPENKRKYEEEITQLEKERGVDVTFIHPEPGYVIKTSADGNSKCFINICANEHVGKPTSQKIIKEGAKGLQWSLPHSLSPPRDDVDNKGVMCKVFDVVFHGETLKLAEKNNAFRTMVNNTACEAVESNLEVKLDKNNLKFPKLSYKGMARPCVTRKPSENIREQTPEEKAFYEKIFATVDAESKATKKNKQKKANCKADNNIDLDPKYTTPKYVIKHRSHVDIQDFTERKDSKLLAAIPKELQIEVNLPLLKSSSDIVLDVTAKTLQLTSERPAKYKLHLTLPYQVNETSGSAKFDKDMRKLVITLPVVVVVVKPASLIVADRDDSGVESDHNSPGTPESEEELILSDAVRTSFLDNNLHYQLPEFTCHAFENTLAFTLNVKNVDEGSVGKHLEGSNTIHVKFTSISSSFYPSHYAFYLELPKTVQITPEEITVETWDNNVVLQVPFEGTTKITSYNYGLKASELTEKSLDEPSILNKALQETPLEEPPVQTAAVDEDNSKTITSSNAIDIVAAATSSYESSGDELSCSYKSPKNKGILKRFSSKRCSVGRSISESSLDELVCCSSSLENGNVNMDYTAIPEDGEHGGEEEEGEVSTSLKKTVRFKDAVMRQLFRSDSSILGQKKKNQRKARNKKRAQERRHSESETSEVEEKKERDSKTLDEKTISEKRQPGENEADIFHLDMDN